MCISTTVQLLKMLSYVFIFKFDRFSRPETSPQPPETHCTCMGLAKASRNLCETLGKSRELWRAPLPRNVEFPDISVRDEKVSRSIYLVQNPDIK